MWRKFLLLCICGVLLPGMAQAGDGAHGAAAQIMRDGNVDGRLLRFVGVLPKDGAEQYELSFWESIRDSNHVSDYEAYLQAYPKGRFAALARARIERLRTAAPKAETPAEPSRPAARPAPAEQAKPAQKPQPEQARPAAPASRPVPEQARPAPSVKTVPDQARPAPDAPAPPPRPSAAGAVAAGEIRDCSACPVLISLPRGSYVMGSNVSDPSEKPAHQVTLGAPFAIGKFEVTVEQWNACADASACPRLSGDASRPRAPVRDVSWDDTQLYLKWLSKQTGKSYRLPTEAEWEFAARGGTASRYWWGDQMRAGQANCKDCGQPWQADAPVNVGSFAANAYGLHDMNGSVWEWVSDCWHASYRDAPNNGRSWEEPNCRVRVIRGGSWREGADYMPVSTRFKYDASVRHTQNGFRVARNPD
jgi:formylglycine-generating enzyme required for sulfatase activity